MNTASQLYWRPELRCHLPLLARWEVYLTDVHVYGPEVEAEVIAYLRLNWARD